MSDPDGSTGAAAAQSLQQLPTLRPAASPVLQQQLSLPVQQQQSQQQGQAEGLTIGQLQSLSAAGSSGLVVVGSGLHSAAAAAANRAQTPSSQSDSWVAASRAFGEGRPARFSAAADVMSSEGADSPLACRTPGHPSSSSSNLQQQQQQQSTPPSSSKKKKKKEPRDKEEQQRQQLHGLSVMGAL